MATRASYATKSDFSELRDEVRGVREELHEVRDALRGELHEVREELHEVRDALRGEIHDSHKSLRGELHDVRDELKADIRAVGVMLESVRSNMSAIAEAFSAVALEGR